MERRTPIGKSGRPHSVAKRKVRYHQQTLKHLGLIERAGRGVWRLTTEGKDKLRRIQHGARMLAFSTDLGLAIWGWGEEALSLLDLPITLMISSPPYPLRKPRSYGNPREEQYVDFICASLEPVVKRLRRGGSIVLNVSNDIFEKGKPSRSLYRERLVLALHERLGLHKMDEIIWHMPDKAPGPVQWASKQRYQLNYGYEVCYWFTNDPLRVLADNRRVLLPHTERHARKIAAGGEQRDASFADGAYRIHPGRFGNPTPGRIPRNVLKISHHCAELNAQRAVCRELGLPVHGATFPLALPRFFVEYLSEPGDLVVDQWGGWGQTAKACEKLGRSWFLADNIHEYLRGAGERFSRLGVDGFRWGRGFLDAA